MIFNGANFFLLLLLILLGINGYLSQTNSPKNIESFRVVGSTRNIFNVRQFYVQSGSQFFLIEEPEPNLEIGKEYQTSTELELFDINSTQFSQKYLKSLGVSGELSINNDAPLLVNQNCDWYCDLLQRNNRLQRSIKRVYLDSSCSTLKTLNNFLAPNTQCEEIAALSSGLITGDTDGFQKSTNDNFKKLGLSHLVAVSGFQRLLLRFQLPKNFRFLLSILSMLGLILLVGPQPPVLRSTLTLLIIYLALALGRGVQYWRALIYSGIIMLFWNPFYAFSASFQLSFLASFALGANVFHQVNPNSFFAKFRENLNSNILIFFFTIPVLANLAGFVSPLSIIVNLILIPIIPIISILNLLGLIPIVGQLISVIPNIFQALLLFFTNDIGPTIPLLELQNFSLWEIIIYYIFLVITILAIQNIKLTKKGEPEDSEIPPTFDSNE